MATQDTSMTRQETRSQKAELNARKRSRPLTAGQELLFFGITFAVALVLQLVVVLNFADVISW